MTIRHYPTGAQYSAQAVFGKHGRPQARPAKPLTDRQRQCANIIRAFWLLNGFGPTYRDLMAEMGISSTNGIRSVLTALEKKGVVAWTRRVQRGIRLATKDKPSCCPMCGQKTPPGVAL